MAVSCKNEGGDLFLSACCDSVDIIPQSDASTVSSLGLDGGLVLKLARLFLQLRFTSWP